MDIPTIENFFANSSFLILFFTTLYYWSKISFDGESAYTKTGLFGYATAVFCLTSHLICRWVDSGHFPLSNLYESLIFLTWCLLVLHIYIEISLKTLFLGVLTSPALLCLIAFTDFSLPAELQKSSPLVPALQSNWLVMHVTVMIASYAALLLGCLISIAYLIFSTVFTDRIELFSKLPAVLTSRSLPCKGLQVDLIVPKTEIVAATLSQPGASSRDLQGEKNRVFLNQTKSNPVTFLGFLDNLSYRIIGIGFCFLTLGILSGAVWANETWGNYWSWDPKETWAFITWLTFACYLHSRLIGGCTGIKPAWIASFGFVTVWVCYLGVNLLGQGLHSYGFLDF